MTRPLRALLYAAVSTPGQYRDEVSVPDQLAQGRALCAARNWPVVGEVVIPGFSRNYDFLDELRADCPEYDAFIRKIDAAAMDVVVARDYDRLWRTAALQSQVSARCRRGGVQIYSLNQPVEPSDPEALGRDTNDARLVMEAMGGVFAEIDNRTRVRRMHAGKVARVRNEGLPITGWAPYGYRMENHKSIWIVDEAEAHWVRYIFRRRLEGTGVPHIARELMERGVRSPGGARAPQGADFWHTRTLLNILANPAYYGGVRWGSAFNPRGAHEPIIDRADWERVQELGRTRFPRYTKMPDPAREELVGIVRCGHCGYAMKVRRDYPTRGPHGKTRRDLSRPFHVVSCARALEYPADCSATHTHRLADVLGWLIPRVQEELRDPAAFLAAREDTLHATLEDDLAALEAQSQVIQRERDRWDAAYRQGYIDLSEFGAGRERMNQQLAGLATEAERLRGRLTLWNDRQNDLQEMARILDDLPQMAPERHRPVWMALIDHLRIFRGRPAPHWEIVYR